MLWREVEEALCDDQGDPVGGTKKVWFLTMSTTDHHWHIAAKVTKEREALEEYPEMFPARYYVYINGIFLGDATSLEDAKALAVNKLRRTFLEMRTIIDRFLGEVVE